ncbi:MAG: hypothetical protein DBP02_15175 [gamma proteobacterium symbiont of Ctena orbiculata]|nr:MAG: hypothetical protein DBP02_15175 [gamma proteobacterium symbiont of Ctena orbiculata]
MPQRCEPDRLMSINFSIIGRNMPQRIYTMAEILIYDVIGEDWFGDGVSAKKVKDQLDGIAGDDEITVRINSPGGDVFDGFAIYNLLKQANAIIRVVVDGYAASAASVIAMAGDSVEMAENTYLMIHNPYTFAIGSADDFRAEAETLDKIKGSIVNTYVKRSGDDPEVVSAAMDAETWYTAQEAVDAGLADLVIDASESKIENLKKPWINKAPKIVTEQPNQETPEFRIAARKRLPIIA